MSFDIDFCFEPSAMKQIPTSQVFAPRREPCFECSLPVFIAERLRIPYTSRTKNEGEEDSGGGKPESPSQQSFILMHRTCFRCARCHQQLSPAGGYYETESGAFCCEVCPDEEPPSPVSEQSRKLRGDPEGMLAVGTDDEASDAEDEADAAAGSNMDSYSEDFESALEASHEGGQSLVANGRSPTCPSGDTRLQSGDPMTNGDDSSLVQSSSNSPVPSLKSHQKSSPIVKPRRKLLLEDENTVGGEERSFEHKLEVKGAESQLHQTGESQLAQRLHPVNEISKQEDSCSDEVVLKKEETEKSSEEVKVPSARPFSVFDRVRMFEKEVQARQPLPKDSRCVVDSDSPVKRRDLGDRLNKGKSVSERRHDESPSDTVHPPFPVVKRDAEVENISKDDNSKPEETEALDGGTGKIPVEDIPFMDENSDTPRCAKEVIHFHEETTISLPCKEVETDISSRKEVPGAPYSEMAVELSSNEISDYSCKDVKGNNEEIEIHNEILPKEAIGDEVKSPEEGSMLIEKVEEKSVVDFGNESCEIVVNVPENSNTINEMFEKESVRDKSGEVEMIEGKGVEITEHPKEVVESKVNSGPVLEVEETKLVLESPKDEGTVGTEDIGQGKHSVRVDYPDDLNPFGDDDEEDSKMEPEVVLRKPVSSSLNPFGSSDEEEDGDEKSPMLRKSPVPAIRRSGPILHDIVGRAKEPSAEDRLNPFWSAGEDDDKEDFKERSRRKSLGNTSRPDIPVPKPRTVWSSVTSTPEPSPLPRRGISPSPSADSTLMRKRRKKPAPPPPVQQNANTLSPTHVTTPLPPPSLDTSVISSHSPSVSTATSPSGTPRRPRKSRPAPPRPVSPASVESTPSASENVPLIQPEGNTKKVETPEGEKTSSAAKEEESPKDQDPKPPLESPPMTRPPPESEKRQKDVENRNRRSRTSGGEEEDAGKEEAKPVTVSDRPPDKSTFGQWKRKKGPAPPRPLPQKRKLNPHVPMSEIRRELCDIEVQQMELERQGVALERSIRARFQQEESPNDAWIPVEVEAQVLQLFELVNEKNELFRRQAELMYMRRQLRLEEEHADLEFQIRCLMERPASLKTDADKEREEMLIQRLVEVVQARDEVVQCLESDRLREAQEDVTVRARLAGAFPGKAMEKGEEMEEDSVSLREKGKKSKKEKKVWERMKKKVVGKKGSGSVLHLGKGKKKKDADKDVDEVEQEEGRRKEGGGGGAS